MARYVLPTGAGRAGTRLRQSWFQTANCVFNPNFKTPNKMFLPTPSASPYTFPYTNLYTPTALFLTLV